MTKNTILHIGITIVLLALAILTNRCNKDTTQLGKYASEISNYLTQEENSALDWIETEGENVAAAGFTNANTTPNSFEKLKNISKEDFTILVFKGDSMIFWSNNKVIPPAPLLKSILRNPDRKLIEMPVGLYYASHQKINLLHYVTLIPIKFFLTYDKDGQQYAFPANYYISNKLEITTSPTPFELKVGKQVLCWLNAPPETRDARVQWVVLAFSLGFLFSFFSLVNKASIWVTNHYHNAAGSALLIGVVMGLIGVNYFFNLTGQFDALSIFARKFNSPSLGTSLGEWLLSIIILLWLMVFFHREFKLDRWIQMPTLFKILFGVLYNISMMMSILMVVYLLRQLVFDSGITFDLDNLLNLDRFALLVTAGVVLLLAGLFLFSHRMMTTIFRIRMTIYQRVLVLILASLIIFPFCYYFKSDLDIAPTFVVSFALVFVITFDFFLEGKQPGFGWIISWLSIFSLFTSLLFYRYNDLHDETIRLACAKALTINRDSTQAEPLLLALHNDIQADTFLNTFVPPRPFVKSKTPLIAYLTKQVFAKNYLFQHYELSVYAYDKDQKSILSDQELVYGQFVNNIWNNAEKIGNLPNFRFLPDSAGNTRYIIHRESARNDEKAFPVDQYFVFTHKFPNPSKLYSELFYRQPYKNLLSLNRYDFAIFRNGSKTTEYGNVSNYLHDAKHFPLPGRDSIFFSKEQSRTDVAYTTPDGKTTVVVGRAVGGHLKKLYVFSALFTLLTLFMIILAVINSFLVRILPDYYQFYISTKGSLAKRIQYWLVALIVVSFFLIGFLSWRHFSQVAEANERGKMDYRANSMLFNISTMSSKLSAADSLTNNRLAKIMDEVANNFSTDINLYSKDGAMTFTSQEKLAMVGLLSSKMSANALAALKNTTMPRVMETEKVGTSLSPVQYSAIRNQDNQLLGYVGIPYYLSQQVINEDVSDFIGILASLYVFLLFIAGSIAVFVSGSIIKPIKLIGEKITQLRLEDKNQPLMYDGDGQDELSALIEEYNNMVFKLEESKAKLITFEREGAWREMARQVAHDIKNPLTTMKLSMQQLQRIAGGDLDQARDYLKKAVGRLIEQIDSLAYIASEFSMFAKLEITIKHDILLNDLVENVFELFSETENIDFMLNMSPEHFHINGDKNHLMRVFNNLVINATQAIPSDRRGIIRVALYQQDDMAIVRISDNGGGVPEEVAERIFEPNFTTRTSGSGLGLAICKKIVEVHDGRVYFETRQGDGTDFFVELPITKIEFE